LKSIHHANFVHRDFHSGNIFVIAATIWKIGDLGLSQPANIPLLNNEIYGVIPYIAPEIFKGAKFSQASDIYSMGMIMWECTTGCKPFSNIEHNHRLIYNIIDGRRPEITEDTPECLANLIKSCWNPNPKNRPTINKVYETLETLYPLNPRSSEYDRILEEAESKRLELIRLKKLGPEFTEKPHSKAIYTSRSLRSLLPNSSSSINSFNTKQGT
ncbi:kinase-like domain-containing protein, partial [Glomus cerebriforme]